PDLVLDCPTDVDAHGLNIHLAGWECVEHAPQGKVCGHFVIKANQQSTYLAPPLWSRVIDKCTDALGDMQDVLLDKAASVVRLRTTVVLLCFLLASGITLRADR